jgi:hypothetical protein
MQSSPAALISFDIFDFLNEKSQWNQSPLINNQTKKYQTGLSSAPKGAADGERREGAPLELILISKKSKEANAN